MHKACEKKHVKFINILLSKYILVSPFISYNFIWKMFCSNPSLHRQPDLTYMSNPEVWVNEKWWRMCQEVILKVGGEEAQFGQRRHGFYRRHNHWFFGIT